MFSSSQNSNPVGSWKDSIEAFLNPYDFTTSTVKIRGEADFNLTRPLTYFQWTYHEHTVNTLWTYCEETADLRIWFTTSTVKIRGGASSGSRPRRQKERGTPCSTIKFESLFIPAGFQCNFCFRFHFQQTLRIQIQGSQGCQKIRKVVRNLKLPIARSTIHPSLSKIKNNLSFFKEFWGAVCWWILEADPLLRGCMLMNSRGGPLFGVCILMNSMNSQNGGSASRDNFYGSSGTCSKFIMQIFLLTNLKQLFVLIYILYFLI